MVTILWLRKISKEVLELQREKRLVFLQFTFGSENGAIRLTQYSLTDSNTIAMLSF